MLSIDTTPYHCAINNTSSVIGAEATITMKDIEMNTTSEASVIKTNDARPPMINIPTNIFKEMVPTEKRMETAEKYEDLKPVLTECLNGNVDSVKPVEKGIENTNGKKSTETISNGVGNSLLSITNKSILNGGNCNSKSSTVNTSDNTESGKSTSNVNLSNRTSTSTCASTNDSSSDKSSTNTSSSTSLSSTAPLSLTASLLSLPVTALDMDTLPDISGNGDTSPSRRLTPLAPVSTTMSDASPPETSELMELAPLVVSNSPNTPQKNNENKNNNDMDCRKSPNDKELTNNVNGLKRALSTSSEKETKKFKLSELAEVEKPEVKSGHQKLIDAEIIHLNKSASKLRRLGRKDLENIVLELFMNQVLHEHELGECKKLCDKLETSLETNRKKTTQYHKELEDLRKVTNRLHEEHQSRKDAVITPIKIKRSVGIQAAPHLIMRGLSTAGTNRGTNASGGAGTTITATQRFALPQQVPVTSNNTMTTFPSGQMVVLNSSQNAGQLQTLLSRPQGTTKATSPQAAVSSDSTRRYFVSQPAANKNVQSPGNNASKPATNNSAVIDLTDEEEGRVAAVKANVVVSRAAAPTTGFVSIQSNALTGSQQYVLVPNSSGGPAALVVANVASSNSLPTNSVQTAASLTNGTRLLVSGIQNQALKQVTTTSVSNMQQVQRLPLQHPAPLPRTPPQQTVGGAMRLPPQPTLKLSHKDNTGIVLSWTMAKSCENEAIASYQLYAYQESTNHAPSSSLWKKVGSVKALELPMACTLTQFMPGHRYHFAVRAVDAKCRTGSFSDPRSIRLEK